MPDTTPRPAVPPISRSALRVVLFGIPDAGKSSLLGALAQAAQTQEHLLDGRLADTSGGLAELQRRLYEGQPRETLEEVIAYPTTFEPFTPGAVKREVVLFDCDGRAANELLTRRRSLDDAGADTGLARQVLDADALVLVVDASASPAQVDADFAEFGRFLGLLEHSRGRRSAVGGLPVFLVLSKCDLLAAPADTPAGWIERIEERKRAVHQRFKDFLAGQGTGPVPFGSIDLHVWATAVKRPELAGSPARPREPYGVAELFRQAFAEAGRFQHREDASSRRLVWTAGGTAGVVAAMIALATAFVTNRPADTPTELDSRVEAIKGREGGSVSRRLSGNLQEKISELRELEKSPDFDRLSQEQKDFVTERLKELEAYRDFLDRVLAVLRANPPREGGPFDDADLDRWQTEVQDLAPPAEYQSAWGETRAVRLRDDRLKDLTALRAAVARLEGWYRDLIREGERLRNFADWRPGDERDPKKWSEWQTKAQTFLERGARQPPAPTEQFQPDGPTLAELARRFKRVKSATQDWDRLKQQLGQLLDLTAALGFPEDEAPGRPALLDFRAPRRPTDRRPPRTLEESARRYQELVTAYPRCADWAQLALPESVAPVIRGRADVAYKVAVSRNPESTNAVGQQAVLDRLQLLSPDGQEKAARWDEVRQWLAATPAELAGWRPLAALLARLRAPGAEDPVAALARFLGDNEFKIDLRGGLVLTLPEDLDAPPTGPLKVFLNSGSTDTTLTFVQRGADQPVPGGRSYTFEPQGEGKVLTYRPGDSFWAEVPVKKDRQGRERTLEWNRCRSQVYKFERLAKPPSLKTKGLSGEVKEDGVKLTPRAADDAPPLPAVPDLLPVVILTVKK